MQIPIKEPRLRVKAKQINNSNMQFGTLIEKIKKYNTNYFKKKKKIYIYKIY